MAPLIDGSRDPANPGNVSSAGIREMRDGPGLRPELVRTLTPKKVTRIFFHGTQRE